MSSEKRGSAKVSGFMGKITADGSSGFPAEANRYHLYVSYTCPFASRAIVGRALKGLEDVISMTVADYIKKDFWSFTDQKEGCTLDTVNNCNNLREIYLKADPNYSGSVSVPVLWDKKTGTIVSNDSAEILHMFATEMNALCPSEETRNLNLYPEHLAAQIDEINEWVNPSINSGVYRTTFAKTQEDYDAVVKGVFDGLDKAEEMLSKTRYLTGNQLTEADIRLFTSLIRFDWVYHSLFKCDKKRIVDYPNLWGYLRDVYQIPKVAGTVNKTHIRQGYYSTPYFNSSGIVSLGPELDLNSAHGRERLG